MKSLVLLAVAPFVAIPPTAAAVESCQGRPATLVGTSEQRLRGTEDADVVVTNGASRVEVLGGDDLVCVTGHARWTSVDAGAGNDVVDASAAPTTDTAAVLGAGTDRYTGSEAQDTVDAGATGATRVDLEADQVDTGPHSAQRDVVATGQPGAPNPDQVVMGSGRVEWFGLATASSFVNGGVATQLQLSADRPDTVAIDAVAGTAVVDAVHRVAFTSIYRFRVESLLRAPRRLTYVGRPYLDDLEVVMGRFPRDARHSVSMGGGNDRLRLESFGRVPSGVRYDAGIGRHDTLDVAMADERRVMVDVGGGRLEVGRAGRDAGRLSGFEDVDVRSQGAVLVGGSESNILRAHACRVRMRGNAGRDQLRWIPQGAGDELLCEGRRARFSGEGGRDSLTGSPGADVLDGGRGPDTAVGRAGRDTCRAETVRSCEVRR